MSTNQPFTQQTTQLQDALACLDLSLEAELALYRRQQRPAGNSLAALPGIGLEAQLEEQHTETPPIDASTHQTETVGLEATATPAPEPLLSGGELTADGIQDRQDRSEVPSSSPSENISPPLETASLQNKLIPVVDTADASPSPTAALAPLPLEDEPETLPEPYDAALTERPEAFEQFLDPSIEDYLESSEALLKHLNDPHKQAKVSKPSKPTTLPPPILRAVLGLVGIVAFVWLAIVLISQWFVSKPREVVPQPLLSKSPSAHPQSSAVSPKPTKTSNTTLVQPAATVATVSPTVTPSAPSSVAASPSPASYYLVVAPYSGAASLEQAKQRVPDAFVEQVQGQQRIQLGLLETQEQAQQLVKELKSQGFSSSILAGRQPQ